MIDRALLNLRPSAQWLLTGCDYAGIEWLDTEQTKPTEAEVNAEAARLQALEPARIADANRKAAYTAESDSLFFKWQAGEATQAEWQAKRDEIRQRFPKE